MEYNRRKRHDNNKLYLFKNGNFYIFIGDDCNTINNYMVLKQTKFSKEYNKCGFPVSSINDYKRVFNNLNLNIEIIDEIKSNPIEILKSINIDNLNISEAKNILKDIKEYYE